MKSINGNAIQVYGGMTTINAKSVTLSANAGRAIRTAGGGAKLDTHDLTISSAEEIKAASEYGASSITINATGLSKINASLVAAKDSAIALSITGTDSFLNGAINEEDRTGNGGVTFDLNNAKWIPTAASNLSTFKANGGVIDLTVLDNTKARTRSVPGITIGTGEGSCTFLMSPDGSSTVTVENGDNFEATGTSTENADNVTDEQATKMFNRIEGVENKTVDIKEGDSFGRKIVTSGADGKPTLTNTRNTLMDAALQQASVTTVALDKILTNDVRKRLGDIRSDANTTGVWMRWDGGKLKGDGLTNNFNTIQIGGDTKVAKNCRIGFAGSFTHGDTEFARGNGELEGFSFALYGTWMSENGMFADVVARLGKFSTEMNVEGRKGDMDNRVASLSGEYGWRFNVCDQFFVEPQVELAYTYVSSEDLQLGTTKFAFDSVDSLTGRAGVVFGWKLPEERGNVYARASVLQQFMGDAKIVGTTAEGRKNPQEIDGNDTWLEYGIGANVKLTDSTYLWADVERTAGADVDEEWRGTVGVRFSF